MEGIQIKKIKLKELEAFAHSSIYRKQKSIPISKLRVKSYISNPRKNDDQYVLYLALLEDRIVGYRSIFQDAIYVNNNCYHFGWFSGNWVDPEFRRHGISSMLFKEVKNDWNDRLMYTNYAPASKALYDKQGVFSTLKSQKGQRYYLVPEVYMLLKDRIIIMKYVKYLVLFAELIFKVILWPISIFRNRKWKKAFEDSEKYTYPTDEILGFLDKNPESSFYRRSKEYKWIVDMPWICAENKTVDYAFTYQVNQFELAYLVSRNKDSQISNLVILKTVDGKAYIPYFKMSNYDKNWLKAIIGFTFKSKAKYLTCYNSSLIKELSELRSFAIFKKSMVQNYYIMTAFKSIIKEKELVNVQDGDGDVIFT